ncbi:MAG: YihY/virulence factor BrkB family protein, partial [Desulfuromonas sp.]|nr:YihY/virulence factor BrkB family protein [Desulfuromonas sp.]
MKINGIAESVTCKVSTWRSQIIASRNGVVRAVLLAGTLFQRERCVEKAAALTYSTLLALVPLLAIMFALLKGLGVHNTLEPLLLKYMSSGSDEVVVRVLDYINNTNVGSLGAVGLVTLLLTVLFLLSNVEKAFNSLWQVRENRSWFRRFADYFSVISFGPLFLLAAISMSSSLRSQTFVQWILQQPLLGEAVIVMLEVVPFLVIWAAFIFLYLFMPNTRVRFSSAAVGGITAGTLWLITQWGYVSFQIGVGKYNAIYGTMAALPVFMIWLYIGWMIALAGGALSRAWQGRETLTIEHSGQETNWHPLQELGVLSMLYRRFQMGEEPGREAELL